MLIPAGIAILIGTAFIAAAFLFGNAMNDSLARQTTAQLAAARTEVVGVDSSESLNEQERNGIYTRTVNDFQLGPLSAPQKLSRMCASNPRVGQWRRHCQQLCHHHRRMARRHLLPVRVVQGDPPVDSNEIALTSPWPISLVSRWGIA